MHGFHKAIEKRLRAIEQRLGTVVEPETTDQIDRRMALCRAALAGEIPEDLTATETVTFSKIKASIPVFQELIDEGIVDAYGHPDLRHEGDDDDLHPDLRHDDDLDAPVWEA